MIPVPGSAGIIDADDLLAYLGLDADSAPAGVTTYLQLANGLVQEAWTTPVTPVPFWVRSIVLEAAGRAVRNPKGLASWTISVDDASRTERSSETAARAGVFLTPVERRALAGKNRRKRMGTIRTPVGY